jgi:arylsulfatase A-like enzyme
MPAQKSILLVTVDCLRADHVGFMGYDHPTTPFLDSLAAESFVIPNAVVAGVPTYYSLPAILASRIPLALGRDIIGLGPSEPTLASILKNAGYATAAFGAGNPYLSARFGYEQGFDTFRDFLQADAIDIGTENPIPPREGLASRINRWLQAARPSMGPLGKLYDELYFEYCQRITPLPESLDALRRFPAADVIVDHACDWLASIGDSPFLLWLHLMDPHSPYYPTDAAVSMLRKSPVTPRRARYLNSFWNRSDIGAHRLQRDRDEIVALYDAGIRWVDEQMKRLAESLRKSNRWDDCILALTADHGEEFLEHGGRYHPPSQLHEELIHVPLLLRLPASRKQEQHPSPFSLMNLAPTLLDAACLPVPSQLQGRSFLEQMRRGEPFNTAVISECVAGCTNPFHPEGRMGSRILAVREARYKLVIHFDPATERFYDLESDPGEQSPLSEVPKPVQRRLLEAALDHLRRSRQRDERMRVRARLREVQLEWARSLT